MTLPTNTVAALFPSHIPYTQSLLTIPTVLSTYSTKKSPHHRHCPLEP